MKRSKISFAAFCRDVLGESISLPWDVVYRAFDGEPLRTTQEHEIWKFLTGQNEYVPRDYRELVCVKGRRAHGTKTAAKYLAYAVHTRDFHRHAAKGDRLHVPVIAQTRDTAREIVNYFTEFYSHSALATEVHEVYKTQIELKNNFVLSVGTCSYRAPRGITAPLGLLDEVGVWRVEGADVDTEVVRSLTPAMIQFPGRKLILLGSPWVKAGVLYDRWQHRADDDDRLVVHCPTALMNPLIPADELLRERQADPQNYRREFEAEWLDDIDQFLPDTDISAAIRAGVRETPAAQALHGSYIAAIDASGLSGKDRFTFGIARKVVKGSETALCLDLLRGWSRTPISVVCDEVSTILKAYKLSSVRADQFGFAFLRELLRQRGIEVSQLAFSARSKPEVFLDLKLALSQARFQLLDHAESLRELRMLESKRTSGGNYSISAPRGCHDDYATVIAILAHVGKTSGSQSRCGGGGLIIDGLAVSSVHAPQPKQTHANPWDPRFWPKKRGSLV